MSGQAVQAAGLSYVIRGGEVGRDRLRVLSGVLERTTSALLDKVGIAPDARCLDVGCGGGDVTALLAARARSGRVVGTDRDPVKIELARIGSAPSVEFRVEDIAHTVASDARYDVVYARFLLSHLPDAGGWVGALAKLLAPGGALVVEDVRINGAFCSPPSAAFQRALEIYDQAARANGGDPEVGPHLPRYLKAVGLEDIGIEVVQPAGLTGDAKRIQLLTLTAIRDSAVATGMTDDDEIDRLAAELSLYVERDDTVVTTAQIVQTWGYRRS
jgi:2-polyprenyl-3-methyl-5-hydroxy-6-metoxy-1,4-benzoquinol methylase